MNTSTWKEKILQLKKERNAVILVHNYQRKELYQVADFIGDSLELSRQAAGTDADVIVFCGVRFMAETAKVLSPKKRVLLPESGAGCSLADTIGPEDVMRLRADNPGAAVVGYVNTSAEVKALCDTCCTSANAVRIVNALPHSKIIFLPDSNLGRYVQAHTSKQMILWDGHCAVHHLLDADSLAEYKAAHPGCRIIAHPECREELLQVADQVCGTGGMAAYARKTQAEEFIVVTECGMTQKLREDVPSKTFHSFCNFCPYMKLTTPASVIRTLETMQEEIFLDATVSRRAASAVNKMLELS